MYIKRLIDKYLIRWKESESKKPLLVRGARQVGKSSAIRNLATGFETFVEINFEELPQAGLAFETDLNPIRIVQELSAFTGKEIKAGRCLLFLDEIQACPKAISALRFFYEKMPDLHVIAAGSLLEFALQELPSFGVGRVRSMFMYPFSFAEFLTALNENQLLQAIVHANDNQPLPEILHQKALGLMKKFWVTGGMPEVVKAFAGGQQFPEIQSIQNDLIQTYRSDFAKYSSLVPAHRIRAVFDSVVRQSGGKFMYSKADENANHGQVKQALEFLVLAGLVLPIVHSAGNGLPLGAEVDFKKQKMMLLDTGLQMNSNHLEIRDILFSDDTDFVNKGWLAEQFWGLEYLKYSSPFTQNQLYYWHREAANANAEVDFIIQFQNKVIPVEVKASGSGRMQSLRQFLKEKKSEFGFRFSTENYSQYEKIKSCPLYGVMGLFPERFEK
jgi:predicted AAA+ superfamily ATPase